MREREREREGKRCINTKIWMCREKGEGQMYGERISKEICGKMGNIKKTLGL